MIEFLTFEEAYKLADRAEIDGYNINGRHETTMKRIYGELHVLNSEDDDPVFVPVINDSRLRELAWVYSCRHDGRHVVLVGAYGKACRAFIEKLDVVAPIEERKLNLVEAYEYLKEHGGSLTDAEGNKTTIDGVGDAIHFAFR